MIQLLRAILAIRAMNTKLLKDMDLSVNEAIKAVEAEEKCQEKKAPPS